ncbi:MAG TPA: glycosyltransferase [Chroococcidiopsis sp.]
MTPIHLFYQEPDPDRFFPGDRYPRRLIRRIVRGTGKVSGHKRVFVNLCAGFDRLGIPYRVNGFRAIQRHPDAIACIIGKHHLLDTVAWKNPILLGASIFSHPCDDPDLLHRKPVKGIVVPGEWVRRMWEPYYGDRVYAWPVGIDTDTWAPSPAVPKDIDILLYDKVRWQRDKYEPELIQPIQQQLQNQGLRVATLRYGFYQEPDFHALLKRSKAMIFLCEHETQGIAYQQALSCDVPVLAWDRGGFWQDPVYFPSKVQFASVSSVPYWDERCGLKFQNAAEFPQQLAQFLDLLAQQQFAPRHYILDHLTLERCAQHYLEIYQKVAQWQTS